MRVTQVLSLLCYLATSWGFAPDNQRTSNKHHTRTKNVFQRESNNANNNKRVYVSTTLSHAAFIQPIGEAGASDVVVETRRKKGATISSSKAALSSAGKQRRRAKVIVSMNGEDASDVVDETKGEKRVAASSKAALSSAGKQRRRRVKGLASKFKQTLSKTTKPIQVKSVKTQPSRSRKLEGDTCVQVEWNARFEQLVEYNQLYGDCMVPQQFQENPKLGQWVFTQRKCYKQVPQKISDENIQRLEDIGFVWDCYQAQWELRFNQLLEYKQQHGDCLVPTQFQENLQLANWVSNQRQRYNQVPKKIPDASIQQLDDIGFVWDAHQAEWELQLKQLLEYKQQHGDCSVPKGFRENPKLAQWVDCQRKYYEKEPKLITDERIQQLENIGFEWDAHKSPWELRFKELLEYKQQHGNCLVPSQFDENPQLEYWVKNQRAHYKSKPKTISDERIQRLESIGFEWFIHGSRWEFGFNQLVEYKLKYGDCLVPWQFHENPQLAAWVRTQRCCYNREPKVISDERIQRLENVGFVWRIHGSEWELRFQELVEYKQQYGDCLVPNPFQDNPQLANWVLTQRSCYNSEPKSISDDRIQRLNDVGFVWNIHREQWEFGFNQLLEYKQQHGDCLVPLQFDKNPQLAAWVKKQRISYRSEPRMISDDRIQRLNDVGFVWNVHAAKWEFGFNQLLEYKQQHGDCLVPSQFDKNRQLVAWVNKQRHSYNSEPKTISDERIQRLENIGFVWCIYGLRWELQFNQLLEYKQQHGDCLVPKGLRENPQLGEWVIKQQVCYNSEPKTISDERIQRLANIGFEWNAHKSPWGLRFMELLEYKRQHGNCLVPSQFDENPQLGYWVRTQRKCYNSEPKTISDELIQRLENIGFEWYSHVPQWELRFNQLVEYKQQYGDCLVPRQFQDNPQLGDWVHTQRQFYKSESKTISDERIQRLESIGFEWDAHKAQWELRFQELVEYKQQYGDCLVPKGFRKNPQLGYWVYTQRQFYKNVPKKISDECIQRLNDIGFAWVGRSNNM